MPVRICKGFSLVEVLVAMTVLALFLAPMVPKFTQVRRQSLDAKNWVIASSLAASTLEDLRLMATYPLTLPNETREVNNMRFDILPTVEVVDPVMGLENARPTLIGYKLKVRVRWNLPGVKDKKHDIALHSLVLRPKSL